ncbi:MAG: hypothetical protein Aureis2KO_08110 [Aureisphaera sp.]
MKHQLILVQLILFICSTTLYAQNYFEGQIDYKIEYESLNENIPKEYLATLIGDSFTAYVKEDKYVMIYNSKGEQGWSKTIVRLDEGFSYLEYEKSDTIIKSRLDENSDKLIALRKETDQKRMILGEMCPSIVLKYESTDPDFPFKITDGRHYYNPKYRLNPEQYKNYTSGFWNKYIELSEAVSIRNEHVFAGFFKSVSEAVKIEERKIPESTFTLDRNKIVVLEE